MKAFNDTISVLDCTLRDGGHLDNWQFPHSFVQNYWKAISNSGVDIVEMGYRSTLESFKGAGDWRYSSDTLLRKSIPVKPANLKLAVMVDIGKIYLEDFAPKRLSPVDLVRVAFYKDHISEGISLVQDLHEKGYETGVNLMGTVQYTRDELDAALSFLRDSPVDVVYLADSFGSLHPREVSDYVNIFRETAVKPIGFHAHDNIHLSEENARAALESGATYIDSTVRGMGRGAGNLPTELFLPYLEKHQERKCVLLPLLKFIDSDIEGPQGYRQGYTEKTGMTWGYQPLFELTGKRSLHPNYARKLFESGYSLSDIEIILDSVNSFSEPGFSQTLLQKAIAEFEK